MNQLDKNFENLMKEQKLASPSSRFSINVMEQIYQHSSRIVYKPLIGKWTWRVLFVLFGSFIGYVFFGADPATQTGKWDFVGKLESFQSNILKSVADHFNQLPTILLLIIIVLSLLLMVDHLFLKKKSENL